MVEDRKPKFEMVQVERLEAWLCDEFEANSVPREAAGRAAYELSIVTGFLIDTGLHFEVLYGDVAAEFATPRAWLLACAELMRRCGMPAVLVAMVLPHLARAQGDLVAHGAYLRLAAPPVREFGQD